jgi:hypothetical protein
MSLISEKFSTHHSMRGGMTTGSGMSFGAFSICDFLASRSIAQRRFSERTCCRQGRTVATTLSMNAQSVLISPGMNTLTAWRRVSASVGWEEIDSAGSWFAWEGCYPAYGSSSQTAQAALYSFKQASE